MNSLLNFGTILLDMETDKQHRDGTNAVDIIVSDHDNQLRLLLILERIIKIGDPVEMTRFAPELLEFFSDDLAQHMELEEDGLFPLLKQRCLPTDDLAMIINQLSYEHGLDRDLVEFLVTDLKKIAHGHHGAIPARFAINAQAFIETQRRHINWENQIVIPLAKKRLSSDDIKSLAIFVTPRSMRE
jgi:hemerythrin-like domain-containing protein